MKTVIMAGGKAHGFLTCGVLSVTGKLFDVHIEYFVENIPLGR